MRTVVRWSVHGLRGRRRDYLMLVSCCSCTSSRRLTWQHYDVDQFQLRIFIWNHQRTFPKVDRWQWICVAIQLFCLNFVYAFVLTITVFVLVLALTPSCRHNCCCLMNCTVQVSAMFMNPNVIISRLVDRSFGIWTFIGVGSDLTQYDGRHRCSA